MTNPAIIKFNVGGTLYDVSQSLVDSYPDTLLAKSASEQWNGDPYGDEVFIERDGYRFQYVLDYMRDGRANIPVGASKDAVLEDLKYYGFEDIKEGNIAKEVNAAQTVLLGDEFLAALKDTAAILNAFCENKSLTLCIMGRQGKSYLDCNDFLKSTGLCVEEESSEDYDSQYSVTLKLV
jgi:hypothetical protein